MSWQFTPLATPLFFGAGLMLGIALLVLRRPSTRGGIALALLSLAITVYVLGYAAELGSTTQAGVLLWLQVQYLGAANAPALLLLLVLAYTGRQRLLARFRVLVLFVVPAITCLLAWTNPSHQLIWRSLSIDRPGGFTWTHFRPGPWYWVHNAYVYLLLVAAVLLLAQARAHAAGLIRRQVNVLLAATLVPVAVHILYLTGLFLPGIDPNPYALLLAAVMLAWGMFDSALWDLAPVARQVVLDHMREAVIVIDARGRLADLNPAARELLKVAPGQGIGQPAAEVFPALSGIAAQTVGASTLRDELLLTAEESQRHFDVSRTPLLERPGRMVGQLLVLHETTQRVRDAERLRLQAVALESAANGIVITDRQGRIQWANSAFTRMTGYTAEEAVGDTTRLLKSGVHPTAFYQDLWRTVLAGHVWRGEMTNRRKDGSLYVEEQTIAPVSDQAGVISHFVAVKQDVTERKHVEDLRETLIHTMVHDLRTPLTVVSGALDLLAPGLGSDPASPLELARKSTQRVLSLLSAILDVHGLRSGKMPLERQPVDLASLIGEAVDLLRPLADAKQQRLSAALPGGLPVVQADRDLLARVVQNLVGNAIKFTPAAGSIQVTAANGRPGDEVVTVAVADNGPGITPELLPSLFHEFVTGQLRGRGSGLGLALCRLAIEAHGGRIRVESEPGNGATFTFTLPLDPPANRA